MYKLMGGKPTVFRYPNSRPARRALGVLIAIGALVLVSACVGRSSWLWVNRNRPSSKAARSDHWRKVDFPGVWRPAVAPAHTADMKDDEEVLGVVVDGVARAYRLGGLKYVTRHVINDLVGGKPISVTYCDISNCVCVYTDSQRSAPLGISVGGLFNRQLVLRVGDDYFLQKSGLPVASGSDGRIFPYEVFPSTRTTWKQWLRRYPNTDVYVGERSEQKL